MGIKITVISFFVRLCGYGSCKELAENCYDYSEEGLKPKQHRRITRHMKICPPCGRFIISYLAIRQVGKESLTSELSVDQKNQLIEILLNT